MDAFQRLDAVKEANPNIWDLYMREAKVYDTAMVERWKTAMEGLLIFAGLFSAVVTAFITESYQMLQPDTGDIMVDLLYQLTQQMSVVANGTQFPPSALLPPPTRTPFSPDFAAIATNILWFISLGLSLVCAVAATLVQQWAWNYIHTIERRPSAERRVHMRVYLFTGVERFKMSHLIDGVPALLHLALFSFFLGLIFFIQPISTPLTAVSIVILVVCVAIYLFATFLPLFAFNSPIQTPLTSVVWQKRIIQILYKTCAHLTLIYTALHLIVKRIVHLLGMIHVISDLLRTIFDLLIRQMLYGFQARLRLPSNTLLQWTALLELPPDVVGRWSSRHVESQTLDSVRSSIANHRDYHFQQREILAFGWLVECLDEYNELLPFIEAIPNFLSKSSSPAHRATFLIVVQQPEFHSRLQSFIKTYCRNARAVSAYVNFYLCLNKEDWTDLKGALTPSQRDDLCFAQYVCLNNNTSLPDLRMRLRCLQGILRSFWKSAYFRGPFTESPAWPTRYLSLWRALMKHCSDLALLQPESAWASILVHEPHLILSDVMLNIVQDLTPANCQAFITLLDNVMLDQITTRCHDLLDCSNRPLPPEEQSLYCATISLVVSVLDMEYRYEVPSDMAWKLHELFHLLRHMSEPSSLKVVNDLLQKQIWARHGHWELEFQQIVEALKDRCDEEGQAFLSSDVVAKYYILASLDSYHPILTMNFDGDPLFRGNTILQGLLLQKAKDVPYFLFEDHETGIEVCVLLFESIFQAFYFFDNHEMLEQALQVVDDFLVRYPYNEHALECRLFLAKRIKETGYDDRGVQALIKPEQGVQVDLQ